VPRRWRLSVCRGDRCREGGAEAVFAAARAEADRLGIRAERCLVSRGGCYGLCELGPNVVVREPCPGDEDPLWAGHYRLLRVPGESHYWHMDAGRVRRVLGEHLATGAAVVDLLCPQVRPKGGK
jgi:(2Fe-2S) ferredoxin